MLIKFSPRDRKIALYVLLAVVAQILTYVLSADARLAARVVREAEASNGGMPRGFALIDAESRGRLAPSLLAALEDELSRHGHLLLRSKDDVLPENRVYGETAAGERLVVGYNNGCDVSLETRSRIPGVVFASYGFHTGPKGAWGVSRVLVWCFGTWIPVWSWGPNVA